MLLFQLSHLQHINKHISTDKSILLLSNKAQAFKVVDWNMPSHRGPALSDMHLSQPWKLCNCWRAEGTQTIPVLDVLHGWIENVRAHLWVGYVTNWNIKDCNHLSLWVPNIVQKMSTVPWKVGIVLEMVWFSSYKLLNIYKQPGPRKRESGNWMGSLWSWEYWSRFLWHTAVHRSFGCEHNTGNFVHTPLRPAALLMLIQEVSLDSLVNGDTVDLCFLSF